MDKMTGIPEELRHMEKSLCLHQWDFPCVNLSSGKVRSCCRIYPRQLYGSSIDALGKDAIFNDVHNRNRRLDMLEGRQHEECNSCWSLESQGAPSPRLGVPVFLEKMQKRLNLTQDELVERMLHPKKYPSILESHHVFELEISFGNKCDLACTYCTYIYSSRIAQEDIAAGRLDKSKYEDEMKSVTTSFNDAFWDWFSEDGYRTVEVVQIIGGEPLINDLFYETVERMLSFCESSSIIRNKKIVLQIISNLNAHPNVLKRFIEKLPRLSRYFDISLLASMESTGERAEYIRFGVNWERFTSNVEDLLKQSKQYFFQFGFLSAVNAFSVTSLEEFLRYSLSLVKKYDWPLYIGYNQVVHPQVLSVLNLDPEFIPFIDKALQFLDEEKANIPSSWNNYIQEIIKLRESFHTLAPDPKMTKQLRYWISDNDMRTGRKTFSTVFPEMKEFLRRSEMDEVFSRTFIPAIPANKLQYRVAEIDLSRFQKDPDLLTWFNTYGLSLHFLRVGSGNIFEVKLPTSFIEFVHALKPGPHFSLEFNAEIPFTDHNLKAAHSLLSQLGHLTFPLRLRVELENAGDRGPYFPDGMSWDMWKRRILELQTFTSARLEVSLSIYLTVFSAPFLPRMIRDLAEIQHSEGILFILEPFRTPKDDFLNPFILGEGVREYFADALFELEQAPIRSSDATKVLKKLLSSSLPTEVRELKRDFAEFIVRKDSGRGTDFSKLYPELKDFYEKACIDVLKNRFMTAFTGD